VIRTKRSNTKGRIDNDGNKKIC